MGSVRGAQSTENLCDAQASCLSSALGAVQSTEFDSGTLLLTLDIYTKSHLSNYHPHKLHTLITYLLTTTHFNNEKSIFIRKYHYNLHLLIFLETNLVSVY